MKAGKPGNGVSVAASLAAAEVLADYLQDRRRDQLDAQRREARRRADRRRLVTKWGGWLAALASSSFAAGVLAGVAL